MPARRKNVEHENLSIETDLELRVELVVKFARTVTSEEEYGQCEADLTLEDDRITVHIGDSEIPFAHLHEMDQNYIREIVEKELWEEHYRKKEDEL